MLGPRGFFASARATAGKGGAARLVLCTLPEFVGSAAAPGAAEGTGAGLESAVDCDNVDASFNETAGAIAAVGWVDAASTPDGRVIDGGD